MKVKELLTDETRWSQGAYAHRADGEVVKFSSPEAVSFCLVGAISRCYWLLKDRKPIYDAVCDQIGESFIPDWNDAKERTFAEVRALVEELDI